MLNRREFLSRGAGAGAAAFLLPTGCARQAAEPGVLLNDVHSGLNETNVAEVARPASAEELRASFLDAVARGMSVSIAGGRHAMGGQQFGENTFHVDTTGLTGVLDFDPQSGQVEVEAGIQWPALYEHLLRVQDDPASSWGIRQKQSGADRLSLGGALAANVHSRSLTSAPIVQDVEAFTLLNPQGEFVRCSRTENADLFSLAIGGYGLFGIVTSVRLRLGRRTRVERVVEIADARDLMDTLERRIDDGFLYGDFQYATDYRSENGLREGVLSCYRPVETASHFTDDARRHLGRQDWLELVRLAHEDPARAFGAFSAYYLSTSGQTYWSDAHQLSTYVEDYHAVLGSRLGRHATGGEMITEIHVPRSRFAEFMDRVRDDFRRHQPNLIYGTVRLVQPETDTFLAWATEPWACIIFNLHVRPDRGAVGKAADDFRRLIDRGLEVGGTYYLTYHRWATREQLLAAHPKLPEFLQLKRARDPQDHLQSEWYRYTRDLVAASS